MMNPEKKKILEMVQEGKVNAEEAARLFDALDQDKQEAAEASSSPATMVKIKVSDKHTGEVKTNISLPLKIARFLKALVPAGERERLESQGIDLDTIFARFDSDVRGKLVEVEDRQNGHLIEVWIE